MPRYRVTLMATASTVVEVEAEDRDAAIEAAFEDAPVASWDWPDVGDWLLPSEYDPKFQDPEDDVEEVE